MGRIGLITEVSLLLSHNVSPRAGHLEAAYQIFEFLSDHERSSVVFDSSLPEVEESRFKSVNWSEIYGDMKEELPSNMPKPRGNPVVISMFCDAAFAVNIITRRSQTGILIFINQAPVT